MKEIEFNRIRRDINLINKFKQIDPIRRWIVLFGERFNCEEEVNKLSTLLERKRKKLILGIGEPF